MRDEPAQERQVRDQAADLGLRERLAQARRSPSSRVAPWAISFAISGS